MAFEVCTPLHDARIYADTDVFSFGRNPVRLAPGINLKIPVYHTVQVVDLRESSISIPNARPVYLLFPSILLNLYIQLPGYTSDNASANLITS